MSSEKRSFFRFDVNIPYYLEPLNENGGCLHVERDSLISPEAYQTILQQSHELKTLFQDSKHIENGGVQLFAALNKKLELMVWLLESVLSGEDVRHQADYQQHINQNQKFTMPDSNNSSKVFPLLNAFYLRVDAYIAELVHVIENSVQGKVFMFDQKPPKPFKVENYIKGLDSLAKKGNWLAKVILALVAKLNYYEDLFSKLKQAYKELSDTESWPTENVNLGAGGFAVYLSERFALAQKTCVIFQMDQEFVFAQGSCVYQAKNGNAQDKMRTAFQFDDISSEDSAHIVRFLMAKELEASGKVPT